MSGSDRRDIRRDLDETVEWWIENSVHLLKRDRDGHRSFGSAGLSPAET
jgi:hypothetical protein